MYLTIDVTSQVKGDHFIYLFIFLKLTPSKRGDDNWRAVIVMLTYLAAATSSVSS